MNNLLLKTFKRHDLATLGIGFAFFLAPTVALFAPKGLVILFVFAALLSLLAFTSQKGNLSSFPRIFGFFVVLLIFWGVSSLLWTISFDISWAAARSLPFSMFGGLFLLLTIWSLPHVGRLVICRSSVAGFGLGALLAFFEVISGFAISQVFEVLKYGRAWSGYMPGFVINNGITVLVMFLWPALIILWSKNHRGYAFLALIITVFVSSLGSNFAAIVALGVGAFAFLVYLYNQRFTYTVAAIGLTALILGAPFVMRALPDARTIGKDLPELSFSVYPRLVIWQYASNKIMDRPLIGYGIRTSRAANTNPEPIGFLYRDHGKIGQGNTKAIPLHPHNGIIQLWLELGGVGALIGLAISLSILRCIYKSSAPLITRALLFSALISSICLMSVSYGLWQNWWMAALWLQGGLALACLPPPRDKNPV